MVWQARYAQRTAAHPQRKDRQFTQENLNAFTRQVGEEFRSNPASLFAAIEYAKQHGKFARQKPGKPHAGPPWTSFSILFFPESNIWVLATCFILGPPGGVGVVKVCYLLQDKGTSICIDFSQPFALKIIHSSMNLEKLQSSVSLAQALSTESLMTCGQPVNSTKKYVLMPAYPGQDLLEFLAPHLFPPKWDIKTNVMNFAQRLELSIALLESLETMHSGNCVHGDIKPENFLVTIRETMRAQIVDLDMMCPANQILQATLSSQKKPIHYGVGTYLYMPPELLHAIFKERLLKIPASLAWDVYSVGICIAILFIGKIGPGAILEHRAQCKNPADYPPVNIKNLTNFPWSIYFPDILPKQYDPLVQSLLTILGGFLAPNPKCRSRITKDLIPNLKCLLAEAQKLPYTSRCSYNTPPWPSAEAVFFAKPQVVAV